MPPPLLPAWVFWDGGQWRDTGNLGDHIVDKKVPQGKDTLHTHTHTQSYFLEEANMSRSCWEVSGPPQGHFCPHPGPREQRAPWWCQAWLWSLEVWLPRLGAGIPLGCSPEDVTCGLSGTAEGLPMLELLLYQQAYLDSLGRWPPSPQVHVDSLIPLSHTAAAWLPQSRVSCS